MSLSVPVSYIARSHLVLRMAALENAASPGRFGLSCFDAIDTTGRPTLDDEEEMAGTFPDVNLRLGDNPGAESGTLHITST